MPPTRALVRGLPASFVDALGQVPGAPAIDLALARRQHAAYVDALRGLGLEVTALPADEALPDCCFVEDTAVVAEGLALISRPGAPARRGETDAVAAALSPHLELRRMAAPARLDGGDVMRVGRRLYVGRSARTDAAGRAALVDAFGPRGLEVIAVDIAPGQLHLKCHASAIGDDLVVVAEGSWPAAVDLGASVTVVRIPAEEAYAANVVGHGGRALVAAGYPTVAERLRAEGLEVVPLDVSQLALADGSLTCLSVIF
ncbi:MAG: hypothetical protein CSA66_07035 [Proteobacteria bacterium]|nr:MAG: hypothetical protein CSA66_07035 [Pseudomonadota bacterium]